MNKTIFNIALLTCGFAFLPAKALTKVEMLTNASMNLGWMQSTCYHYTMKVLNPLPARDTLRMIKKDMIEKSLKTEYAEIRESVIEALPKCKELFDFE